MIRKNFTKKLQSYKTIKISLYDKRLITTCLICYNDKCILSYDKKYGCALITRDAFNSHCLVCKGIFFESI